MTRLALGLSLVLGAGAAASAGACLVVVTIARVLRGPASRWSARNRADFWLGLRLSPAVAALLAAMLVALAYARHEPRDAGEGLSVGLLALAAGGAVLPAGGLRGVLRARRQTRRFQAERRLGARPLLVPGAPAEVLAVRETSPPISLVGTRRPVLFMAESTLEDLTPAELEVVMAHEAAHARARDNLKTMLVQASPFPGRVARRIEGLWRQAAEELADERATAGGGGRRLNLASAILKVARRALPPTLPDGVAATTLLRGESLALRVRRLAAGPLVARGETRSFVIPVMSALAALGAALVIGYLLPPLHEALEVVVAVLS